MAATAGHRLRALDGHALRHRAIAGQLLGVGHHHRVGLLELLGVGHVHLVGGRPLLGVGHVHLVGGRPLFLDRHHHRVGLLDLLGVGHVHLPRPGPLFLDRHHHRVGIFTLLGVGHGHVVGRRPRLRNVHVDGVVHRLRALLRHHDRIVPRSLLDPRDLLGDRERTLTDLGRPLRALHFPDLRDHLPYLHRLHAGVARNGSFGRSGRSGIGTAYQDGTVSRNTRRGIFTTNKTTNDTHAGGGYPGQEAESQTLLHRNLQRKKQAKRFATTFPGFAWRPPPVGELPPQSSRPSRQPHSRSRSQSRTWHLTAIARVCATGKLTAEDRSFLVEKLTRGEIRPVARMVPVMPAAAGRKGPVPSGRLRSTFRGSCRSSGRAVSRGSRRFRPGRQGSGAWSWAPW